MVAPEDDHDDQYGVGEYGDNQENIKSAHNLAKIHWPRVKGHILWPHSYERLHTGKMAMGIYWYANFLMNHNDHGDHADNDDDDGDDNDDHGDVSHHNLMVVWALSASHCLKFPSFSSFAAHL